VFEKIKLKNIFFNNINHTNVYYCYLNEIRHKMRNVFIVSAYIKIIYGTIKYVRRAHLIYVINILVSIYAVNLSHRVRVLLKFATVRIRARSERFIFVIIGDCVTQIRAHLSARWKREPRVGPGGFARQKKKQRRRDSGTIWLREKSAEASVLSRQLHHTCGCARPYITLLISGA